MFRTLFQFSHGGRESRGLSAERGNGLKLNPIRAGLTLAASSCVALLMSVSLTARIWSPLRNLKIERSEIKTLWHNKILTEV